MPLWRDNKSLLGLGCAVGLSVVKRLQHTIYCHQHGCGVGLYGLALLVMIGLLNIH